MDFACDFWMLACSICAESICQYAVGRSCLIFWTTACLIFENCNKISFIFWKCKTSHHRSSEFNFDSYWSSTMPLELKGSSKPFLGLYRPLRSRRLRIPHFMTIGRWRWKGCQSYVPATFTPSTHGTHICQRLSRLRGHSATGKIKWMKNPNEPIGNRIGDFPACSAVLHSTGPQRNSDRYRTPANIVFLLFVPNKSFWT